MNRAVDMGGWVMAAMCQQITDHLWLYLAADLLIGMLIGMWVMAASHFGEGE